MFNCNFQTVSFKIESIAKIWLEHSKRETSCNNTQRYIKKYNNLKSFAILVLLHCTSSLLAFFGQKSIEIEWIKHCEKRQGIQSTPPPHVHWIDLIHDAVSRHSRREHRKMLTSVYCKPSKSKITRMDYKYCARKKKNFLLSPLIPRPMPPRILFPREPIGARTQTRSSAFGGPKERGKRKRKKMEG